MPMWRTLLFRMVAVATLVMPAWAPLWGANPAPKTAAAAPRSDVQVERALKERLAKSKVKADGFRFQVSGGVVTWEGQTAVAQRKAAATRMAKSAGARAVVNNIKVSEAGKAKAAAGLRKAQVVKGSGAGS